MSKLPEGWVSLSGRPYPTWQVVLDLMHQAGLLGIESELIQIPSPKNGHVAIVKSTVILASNRDGEGPRRFEALGDASPANVKSNMVPAIIRLAETRAKGRAGRDSVNVSETLAEEMPPDAFGEPVGAVETAPRQPPPGPRHVNNPPETSGDRAAADEAFCQSCGQAVTTGQRMVSLRRYQRVLCPGCQKGALITTGIA